jgi:hypothetical protein
MLIVKVGTPIKMGKIEAQVKLLSKSQEHGYCSGDYFPANSVPWNHGDRKLLR